VEESFMEKQLTQREINDKKWHDHWEGMSSYIKGRLGDCLFVLDEHSIGISKDRRCFQVYGAEESFKFDDNTKVSIKAVNLKTRKVIKVYEYHIAKQELKQCSQAHLIHKHYGETSLQFLQDLRDAVVDYYKPNSIKFITDNF